MADKPSVNASKPDESKGQVTTAVLKSPAAQKTQNASLPTPIPSPFALNSPSPGPSAN